MKIITALKRISIGFITFAAMALLIWYLWAFHLVEDPRFALSVNREDPEDVTRVFIVSLMHNKPDVAKSLVSNERWSQIEAWMAEHNAVNCDFPFDGDLGAMGGIAGFQEESETWKYDYYGVSIPCARSSEWYDLQAQNIILQRVDSEWQIVDWQMICEYWREKTICNPN